MNLKISVPTATHDLKPRIAVVGVGGAGGNAINNMIHSELEGVDFIVANTDAQALAQSRADRRIQLGVSITQGLGAGSRPDVGHAAAEEAMEAIVEHLQGANMAFITAGMGGGTGTGAAPVIARAAREMGILTVGVVTKPFHFEGIHRMRLAEAGIQEMQRVVDTLIIIPNQNLFRIANEKTTFADAFKMADDVLYSGVRGVTDLIVMPGLINLDFADIRAIMAEMGKAMMGTGEAGGDRRALDAAEAAISNPLLDDSSMAGATGVLINITGGMDMTLFEVDEAAERIRSEVDPEAHIIFGSTFDESLEGKLRVSIVATGMTTNAAEKPEPQFLSVTELRGEGRATKAPTAPAAVAAAAPKSATVLAMRPATMSEPMAENKAEVPAESAWTEALAQAPAKAVNAPAPMPAAAAVIAPAAKAGAGSAPIAPVPTVTASGAFIPPMPAERSAPRSQAQADPFASAALTNGANRAMTASETFRAAVSEPAKPAPKKAPSLFERVTGTGFGRAKPEAPAPVARFEPQVTTARTPAAPDLPPAPAPKPEERPQTRLGGLEPTERLAPSSPEEDLLDIPAFLRRQAN